MILLITFYFQYWVLYGFNTWAINSQQHVYRKNLSTVALHDCLTSSNPLKALKVPSAPKTSLSQTLSTDARLENRKTLKAEWFHAIICLPKLSTIPKLRIIHLYDSVRRTIIYLKKNNGKQKMDHLMKL